MTRTPWKAVGICGASVLLGSVLSVGAESPWPEVELVWNDPYGLFPRAAREDLREQLASFACATSIALRVRFPGEGEGDSALPPAPRVHVTLRPGGGQHWGLEDRAMAAAIGERGGSHAIFVFVDAVRRTLGHAGSGPSPRETNELTRALARVVEHELVHVLAPERGHAVSGLMSRRLTRPLLLAQRLELDLTSLVRARAGALQIAAALAGGPPATGISGATAAVSNAPPPPSL